ncbi:MAG TPA: GNAT family N-acetyltransferase [Polyangiaceae bacterium]|jgi:predicted GNAT family N-acyltransferase|nr:GNAT family N-acetyltransferase [Polyangiaceae bacterium]
MDLRIVATQADLDAALRVRHEVFVEEQGVSPSLEIDEFDQLNAATHAIASRDGQIVAAGRLRMIDANSGKLERLAVLASERAQGAGRALTLLLEGIAKDRGCAQMLLNSQQSARGFYEKLGYIAHGDPFVEAGIDHIAMRKTLR